MILTELDRTFFEYLRLQIVEYDRLPDWRELTGTLAEKRTAYRAAKEEITAPIEVIGYGNAKDRGTKKGNTIILDRKIISTGNLGGFKTFFPPVGETIEERPKNTVDISYEVRYFSTDIFDFNLLENIVVGMFTGKPFFKLVGQNNWELSGENIFIQYTGTVDLTDYNFAEKVLTFTVKDIFLDTKIQTQRAVPINSISFDVYAYFSGELNENNNDTGSVETVVN